MTFQRTSPTSPNPGRFRQVWLFSAGPTCFSYFAPYSYVSSAFIYLYLLYSTSTIYNLYTINIVYVDELAVCFLGTFLLFNLTFTEFHTVLFKHTDAGVSFA
eukprot:Rmarinus@m.5102